jgi:hypothetical protein
VHPLGRAYPAHTLVRTLVRGSGAARERGTSAPLALEVRAF